METMANSINIDKLDFMYLYYSKFTILFKLYNLLALIRKELETTETEDMAMAKPAKAGFKSQPKNGKNNPPANGMPMML